MTRRLTRSALAAILVLAVSPLSARAQPRAEPGAEPGAGPTWTADNGNGTFSNPLFYDEFSDCDLIRVGKDFYLTGTTMHSMPGLPILHSRDLVNWRFLAYALDTLDLGPAFRLDEGKRVYGQGIWAPSFRFHKGTFHIFSNVNGQTTQLFRATNPAGPWTRTAMKRSFHDLSVLFDGGLRRGRLGAAHARFHEARAVYVRSTQRAFRETPFARILAVEHAASTDLGGDQSRRYGDTAITFCYAP